MDERVANSVWMTGGCATWYLDERSGRLTTLWPDFAHTFHEEVSSFELEDYTIASLSRVLAETATG